MVEFKFTPSKWIQSHRPIPNDKKGMYATQVYTEDGETIATLSWYPMPKIEVIHKEITITITVKPLQSGRFLCNIVKSDITFNNVLLFIPILN